jgi:DNA-binding NarL/FixJ family response regulator
LGNCGSVLIADGDRESRDLLSVLVERIGYLAVHAESGACALATARADRPCLAVIDTQLPDISGYVVCRELRDEFGEALPIVFVSESRNEPNDRIAGLLLGADDYFSKPPIPDEFLVRVRRLLVRSDPPSDSRPHLTRREREVLSLLAAGRRRQEIATELVLSPKTVAKHIENVYAKLGVNSEAQAVGLVLRERLLDTDDRATSRSVASPPVAGQASSASGPPAAHG